MVASRRYLNDIMIKYHGEERPLIYSIFAETIRRFANPDNEDNKNVSRK